MINMLMFLPRLFRYFGMFQTFIGVVRPMWPNLSRFWQRFTPNSGKAVGNPGMNPGIMMG